MIMNSLLTIEISFVREILCNSMLNAFDLWAPSPFQILP